MLQILASTDLDRPTVFSPVDARNEFREERPLLRPLTFSGHAKARAFLALLRLVISLRDGPGVEHRVGTVSAVAF